MLQLSRAKPGNPSSTFIYNTGTLVHSKFGKLFASELWQFRLPRFTIFQNNGMSYILILIIYLIVHFNGTGIMDF